MYQGQGSSEFKLGGKCKICIIFWKVEVQLQPNLDLHVKLLLGEWVGLRLI